MKPEYPWTDDLGLRPEPILRINFDDNNPHRRMFLEQLDERSNWIAIGFRRPRRKWVPLFRNLRIGETEDHEEIILEGPDSFFVWDAPNNLE